jgi:hypothetical protein
MYKKPFDYICLGIQFFMNLQKFNILVVVALLSMIGVVVMQVYWVRNAFQLKEEQFNRSVSIAMKSVLNRILELNTEITIKRLADDLPCNVGKMTFLKPFLHDCSILCFRLNLDV